MKKSDMETMKTRKNEEGAAMVMVILISFLLLVACVGVLLESSLNSANVTDAVAEQQAYYAAESGIQSALNVLRGNTTPLVASAGTSPDYWANSFNPLNLIETRASAQASPSPTPDRIDFRKAVSTAASNYANDPSGKPRLSRWLKYNYTSTGSSFPDRVKVGSGNESAFNLDITDPDKTGDIISFKTKGGIYDPSTTSPGWKSSIIVGGATISYVPTIKNNLDVTSGSKDTDFGSFTVVGSGTLAEDVRFQIVVDMTAPYTTSRVISGWILKGTISSATQTVVEFSSPASVIMGSTFSIKDLDNYNKMTFAGSKVINGNVTQSEPTRLVIKSTGYGPRGAKKQLETVVQKNFFNGMTAPATLTLVGPPSSSNGSFAFSAGSSQNVTYSGDDIASNVLIPSIGTTNDANLDSVFANLGGRSRKADIIGYPSNVNPEMPFWLQSTQNLNATIEALKTVAKSSGRYYSTGQSPSNFGNSANATGITFVDGNVSYSGSGGGILVVTGKLTLHGGFDFNGLIIVTGGEGVQRSGGGNGLLQGNTVIAPYNPSNLNAGFMAPKYDISGGGNSTIRYNSSSLANGMTAVSNFILGVAEK